VIFLCRWGLVIFGLIWPLIVLPAEYARIHYADFNQRIVQDERIELAQINDAIDVRGLLEGMKIGRASCRERV